MSWWATSTRQESKWSIRGDAPECQGTARGGPARDATVPEGEAHLFARLIQVLLAKQEAVVVPRGVARRAKIALHPVAEDGGVGDLLLD